MTVFQVNLDYLVSVGSVPPFVPAESLWWLYTFSL